MVQPGKATLAWRILLPELCDRLFCCFIVYVQPPLALWPCQLFMTDRKKKKKKSLSCLWESWDWLRPGFTGDLRGRYQVNTGRLCFFFMLGLQLRVLNLCWWLLASLGCFLSLQPASVWRSRRFMSVWRTDFANLTQHLLAAGHMAVA